MITLEVRTHQREELLDITSEIEQLVSENGICEGQVTLFVPHTTAALTINENADPDVKRDILYKLERSFPRSDGYHHAEGNSDAHIKASLFGFSETVLVHNGSLLLGQWQAIYFCEFDGPRPRKLAVKISPDVES
ncbi:MAG: secondary thiamine-phosphate synthase enzyme YjbQ [bacterium]|nr:secondary thiamine-phosphate synthase enzyme YjbQ [bacterium]